MSDDTPRGPIHRQVPPGDNRERLVCNDCGFINYANPKVVVLEGSGHTLMAEAPNALLDTFKAFL